MSGALSLTLSLLKIGRISASLAECNAILASVGKNVKLVSLAVAHVSAIGLNGNSLKPTARKDALVSVIHVPVCFVGSFGINVKRIAVLHQKLLRAHEAEPRASLVTEFPLNLIKRNGKLAVGANNTLDEICDLLLGCGTKGGLALGAILELKHIWSHRIPAAGGAPKLSGLKNRHYDFKRTSLVHLITDNSLHFLEGAHAKWKISI